MGSLREGRACGVHERGPQRNHNPPLQPPAKRAAQANRRQDRSAHDGTKSASFALIVKVNAKSPPVSGFADRGTAANTPSKETTAIPHSTKRACRCWNTTACRTKEGVRMGQEPEERLRSKLANRFDEFHPKQHSPVRHLSALQDLVFVVQRLRSVCTTRCLASCSANGVQLCGVA